MRTSVHQCAREYSVVFRVDSSAQIGTGHLMRCLALAEALQSQRYQVEFIARALPGHLNSLIVERGFELHELPAISQTAEQSYADAAQEATPHAHWLGVDWQHDAQQTSKIIAQHHATPIRWLVVDHYALDCRWEALLRPHCQQIMVIDDLADRSHDCDLLLEQHFYLAGAARYAKLVPPHCQVLAGPRYAMLRPEFALAHQQRLQHPRTITEPQNILVFFGGADLQQQSLKLVHALQAHQRGTCLERMQFHLIAGLANPALSELQNACASLPNLNLHTHVRQMSAFMMQADLALGAAGVATLERFCVGLPSLVIVLAANQAQVAQDAHQAGLLYNLGWHGDVEGIDLIEALERCYNDYTGLQAIQDRTLALVDGQGLARVLSALVEGVVMF